MEIKTAPWWIHFDPYPDGWMVVPKTSLKIGDALQIVGFPCQMQDRSLKYC